MDAHQAANYLTPLLKDASHKDLNLFFYGTSTSSVVVANVILADYGQDSTCAPQSLQEAETIGSFFATSTGVCVYGQKFDCIGNDVVIHFCSASDCSTGCTQNATAPNGGCWNDVFNNGTYFRLTCGSLDLSTGTIPGTTTGQPTSKQICDNANPADWTYGSGYYCLNGGSAFVQCYDSGSGVIQCPAGTSCHCASGVECSNHGTTSPCTF